MTTTTRDELRNKIKSLPERIYRTVEVLGESFTVQSLTLKEQAENDVLVLDKKSGSPNTAKVSRQQCDRLCRSVIDGETKEPLFGVDEWKVWLDVPAPVTSKLLMAIDSMSDESDPEGDLGNSSTTGD